MNRTPEHTHFSEPSEKEHARDLKTLYHIDDTLMWEPELAAEAMQTLREQEKDLEGEAKRALFMSRWVDAFYPPQGLQTASQLASEHVIEPTRVYALEDQYLRSGTHVEKTAEALGETRRLTRLAGIDDFSIRLYGTDLFADVSTAGTWAKVPKDTVRVLGSSKFSCCTAIAGISKDGCLCFAHIPGPGEQEVLRVGKAILETKFGPGRYVMISPERLFQEGSDPRNIALAEQANQAFKETAAALGLQQFSYTEMFPDPESVFHNISQAYGMILTPDGIHVQRLHATHHKPPLGRYWSEPYLTEQQVLHDVPAIDIPL